jgi:hypothetical protein
MKNKDPEFYKKYYYKHKYEGQRKEAERRGIKWEITFEEWYAWWGTDIEQRGPYKGQLVMARHGDVGPYRLDNISKLKAEQNASDARLGRPASKSGLTKRIRRTIMTPKGKFDSINLAAESYGMTSYGIRYYVRTKPADFYYMEYTEVLA